MFSIIKTDSKHFFVSLCNLYTRTYQTSTMTEYRVYVDHTLYCQFRARLFDRFRFGNDFAIIEPIVYASRGLAQDFFLNRFIAKIW
jgi:hypothetical protein